MMRDLNELHHVKVIVVSVERWINKYGKKEQLATDLSDEAPSEYFSGYISVDGTFKSVKTKKKHNLNMAH